MSVVNGMNLYIATKIANLGTNTFVLTQFKWAQGYEAYLKALRRNRPIRLEEYEYLRDTLTGYEAISALAQLQTGPEARYGGRSIGEVTLERNHRQPRLHRPGKGGVGALHHRPGLPPQYAGLLHWPGHCG